MQIKNAKYLIAALIICVLTVSGCKPSAPLTDTPPENPGETTAVVLDEATATESQPVQLPATDIPGETPTEPPPTEAVPPTPTAISSEFGPPPGTEFDEAGLWGGVGARFIPLDNPGMVPAAEATWLNEDDLVLGVYYMGEAQAFPIRQMAYHHIANVEVAGEPYLVTY